MEQHYNALHKKPPANTSGKSTTESSSTRTDSLSCRGNTYSSLTTVDQSSICNMLVASCHQLSCLRKQQYALGVGSLEECGAVEAAGWAENQHRPTPNSDSSSPKRRAVVVDCEMVGVEGGHSEVVQLCVVDFLTGELLTNSLVKPRERIVEWRGHITGVTPSMMAVARQRKQVLDGWEDARLELWRHIDAETVLIGHSLNFDLQALRVVHKKIVDTAILTAETVFGQGKKIRRMWGLKVLCEDLLGLRIRSSSGVHDGLEDVLATRELTLWCLRHPRELNTWANKTRRELRQPKTGRRTERTSEHKAVQKGQSMDEVLRWEDVIDYDTWPKSPPDSD